MEALAVALQAGPVAGLHHKLGGEDVGQLGPVAVAAACDLHSHGHAVWVLCVVFLMCYGSLVSRGQRRVWEISTDP